MQLINQINNMKRWSTIYFGK